MAWKRRGGGRLQCAVLEIGGSAAAYAFYRMNPAFERGVQTGNIFVVEAMGDSPEATNAIWRFLFGIDWLARVKAIYLPLDHPLLLSLADAAPAEFSGARRAVGAADRCRRRAVGARLRDGRCSRDRGHGRILSVECGALAHRARRRREDRTPSRILPATSPRSVASISAASRLRSLRVACG